MMIPTGFDLANKTIRMETWLVILITSIMSMLKMLQNLEWIFIDFQSVGLELFQLALSLKERVLSIRSKYV